jgi:hypothetical protein
MLRRHRLDPGRHRRREQHRLPGLRRRGQDRVHVLGEAHIEHLVGLVQHDGRDAREVEGAAADVVEDAARGADDHVSSAADGPRLVGEPGPAVHRDDADAERLAVSGHGRRHLHGEFPRRGEDQYGDLALRGRVAGGEPVQERQRERGRLAGAGGSEADQILAA